MNKLPVLQSFVSATAGGTSSTSLIIGRPAGVVAGDLLVATIGWYAGNFGSLPAGWSPIDTHNEGGSAWGNGGALTAYKIAGGSEPTNYAFTVGVNTFSLVTGAQGTIMRITGHDPVNPINAHLIGTLDSTSPMTTPPITTTVPNALLIHSWCELNPAGGVSWNTPTGVTLVDRQGSGNNTMLMVARDVKADAGTTVGRDATATSTYGTLGVQIAIAPATTTPAEAVYVDTEAHVNSATNAHVGSYAGALATDDVLVAVIISDNVNVGYDTLKPAGWVYKGGLRYGDVTNVSTFVRADVLVKKLANGTTHNWTFPSDFGGSPSGNLNSRILIHRFTGADLPEAFTILGGRDNALTLPSLTSGGTNRLLVAWGLGDDPILNFSPAAGMTEVYDILYASPTAKTAMDTEVRGSGATGTRDMTSPTAPFGGTRTLGIMMLIPPTPPDLTGPTVTSFVPADGATVSDLVEITVTATDPSGISGVNARIDGVNLYGTAITVPPYTFDWNTIAEDDGTHVVRVEVYDTLGNVTIVDHTVTVDNTPPVVTITNPPDGQQLSGTITVAATAVDATTGIAGAVSFRLDGVEFATDASSPYSVSLDTTTLAEDSAHVLEVFANDSAGNSGSNSVSFTANQDPTNDPKPVCGSPFAERLYAMLEPVADQDQKHGWPLYKYCCAMGRMFDQIWTYVKDGPQGEPGWSNILDPSRVPVEAINWLALITGTQLNLNRLEGETDEVYYNRLRDQIAEANGQKRGTLGAMTRAIKETLIGSKTVYINERAGSAWRIAIATIEGETPDAEVTRRAILSQKPAGIVLVYNVVPGSGAMTWGELFARYDTWGDVDDDFATWGDVATDNPTP